jgi:hypothetical protein
VVLFRNPAIGGWEFREHETPNLKLFHNISFGWVLSYSFVGVKPVERPDIFVLFPVIKSGDKHDPESRRRLVLKPSK